MQFAKDSFYIALRDRLVQVNPSRTTVVEGTTRPGILVVENERPGLAELLTGVFCLNWGAESAASSPSGTTTLCVLECAIEYCVEGTDSNDNADRGRQLTAMDRELNHLSFPASAPKCDYTQTPAAQLGTAICWTSPKLAAVKAAGKLLSRTANMQVYFFSEVN
jgi:hypothetical protein